MMSVDRRWCTSLLFSMLKRKETKYKEEEKHENPAIEMKPYHVEEVQFFTCHFRNFICQLHFKLCGSDTSLYLFIFY